VIQTGAWAKWPAKVRGVVRDRIGAFSNIAILQNHPDFRGILRAKNTFKLR